MDRRNDRRHGGAGDGGANEVLMAVKTMDRNITKEERGKMNAYKVEYWCCGECNEEYSTQEEAEACCQPEEEDEEEGVKT